MSGVWQLSALELATTIRSGAASSREVMEAHLARADAVNVHLDAIVRRLVPRRKAVELPVGAQVTGDRFTDLRCLAVAERIPAAAGVHTPSDPVTG